MNDRAFAAFADAQRLAAAQRTAHERVFRTHLLIIDAALRVSAAHRAVEASRRTIGEPQPAVCTEVGHAEVRHVPAPAARERRSVSRVADMLRDVLRFLDSRVTYGLLRLGPALVVASDCLVH